MRRFLVSAALTCRGLLPRFGRRRRMQLKYVREKRCRTCGKALAKDSKIYCPKHLRMNREHQRAWYARQKERA